MERESLKELIKIKRKIQNMEDIEDYPLSTEVDLELIVYHIEEILKRHTKDKDKNIDSAKGYSNYRKLEQRYSQN